MPLGNKPQLLAWDVPEDLVEELDWWQEIDLGGVKIVATPARHYSSRGFFDYQETLWSSCIRTFDLGHHEWDAPIIRTIAAAEKAGVQLITPKLGEMVDPANHSNINWWDGIY